MTRRKNCEKDNDENKEKGRKKKTKEKKAKKSVTIPKRWREKN